jgi:hypothetical protein
MEQQQVTIWDYSPEILQDHFRESGIEYRSKADPYPIHYHPPEEYEHRQDGSPQRGDIQPTCQRILQSKEKRRPCSVENQLNNE